MGDTSSDPLDRQRSSRPRVGQMLKNPAKAPGLFFVAVAVVALGIGVASLAYRQVGAGITAIIISLLAAAAGVVVLVKEAIRLRKLERPRNINSPPP